MKRYAISEWENDEGCLEQGALEESPAWGDYCLYEEARQIEVDRDIKAADLQLLVDKVLAAGLLQLSTGRDILPADEAEEDRKLEELVELARNLKQ